MYWYRLSLDHRLLIYHHIHWHLYWGKIKIKNCMFMGLTCICGCQHKTKYWLIRMFWVANFAIKGMSTYHVQREQKLSGLFFKIRFNKDVNTELTSTCVIVAVSEICVCCSESTQAWAIVKSQYISTDGIWTTYRWTDQTFINICRKQKNE